MKLNKEHKSTITSNIDDEKFGARREALNKRCIELGKKVYETIYTPELLWKMGELPTNSFQRKSRMQVCISAERGAADEMLRLLILEITAAKWDREVRWDYPLHDIERHIAADVQTTLDQTHSAGNKYTHTYLEFGEGRLVMHRHVVTSQSLNEWPDLWQETFDYLTEYYQVMLESAQLRSKVKAVLEKVNTSKKFLDLWPDGHKYLPEDGEGRCSDISHADAILDIQKMMEK